MLILIEKKLFAGFVMLICIVLSSKIYGQQEAFFSQYMFNQQALNPAYVGIKNFTQITVLNHSQWLDIEGAPENQAVSLSTKIAENIGLGFTAITDKIGPLNTSALAVDFGYHLLLNDKGLRVSLGLKISGRLSSFDFTKIKLVQPQDNSFNFQNQNEINLNFGTGFYIYNPKFYFGIGIPFLIDYENINIKKNYYAIIGGIYPISDLIELRPSILFQKTSGINLIYDNSIWVVFNKRFWIGPQYRTTVKSILPSKSFGGYYGMIAGLNLGRNLSIGYAYQGKTTNQLTGITNSTHEILLRFKLVPKVRGVLRSPRLF